MAVDDEKDVLSILKSGLESRTGFQVDTFASGEAALDSFLSHPPGYYDLIVTDIRMPSMNGFELYRRIREKDPSVRIAFITAFEISPDEFSKVMPSIKVKDFIRKPIMMKDLVSQISSILVAVQQEQAFS